MKINYLNCINKHENAAITLDATKSYLKVTNDKDDFNILTIIDSVESIVQSHTGIALIDQEVDFLAVNLCNKNINLPIHNLSCLLSIIAFDINGNYKKLTAKEYHVDSSGKFISLSNISNVHAIKVHYIAGVTNERPIDPQLKLIILSHIAYCYENRTNPSSFSMQAYSNFKKYRL